ncbi:MAG: prepilin-type N-terminal cleavage/methylation domain-containing protein [Ruminococcus sp.]|nr:prepilin-type N-terminal cleavage/methylation domain-containing protein [Ruminococcus sp.]
MKKFKGFTLIELIVVIAIIGVLCAILVPSMMGWVTKSRVNSANSNAKSIFNSAASCITSFDTLGHEVLADSTYGSDGSGAANVVSGTTDGTSLADEVAAMEEASNATAEWAFSTDGDGYVEAAIYSSNGNNYMGAFPNGVPEKQKRTFNVADLETAADVTATWGEAGE